MAEEENSEKTSTEGEIEKVRKEVKKAAPKTEAPLHTPETMAEIFNLSKNQTFEKPAEEKKAIALWGKKK